MGGRASRQKGNRFEREGVAILTAAGLVARRIPLSGAMRGFKGDIELELAGRKLRLEAKSRKHGFKFIYEALADNDALLVKTDRSEPLVIMPLRGLAALLGANKPGEVPNPTSINRPPNAALDPLDPTQYNIILRRLLEKL